jgi:hypothetical protein
MAKDPRTRWRKAKKDVRYNRLAAANMGCQGNALCDVRRLFVLASFARDYVVD